MSPSRRARDRATAPTGPKPASWLPLVGSLIFIGLLIGLVVLAAVSGSGSAPTPPAPTGSHGALTAGEFPEPGVVHVHGLGVDPGDGTLYAATHSGLFALPERGKASRVAHRYQDTMGFTVTGAGTFLGSGHPDVREDSPPRLGLIESTDAGRTWSPLSLRGKADFHSLHAAHGAVFGYDATSGGFMVSRDRKAWETRSQLSMRDFVVDPASADTVLATTERGVVRSTDGGRTWGSLAKAPALVVLAWQPGSLYGVAPDGSVLHSRDGGVTWTARGRVGGAPEAMAVDLRDGIETVYVAAADRGILASTDGGRSFTTRYAD